MTMGWIILLAVLIACWYEVMKTRELVIRRCQRVCAEAQLQFLDQTVAVVAMKPGLTNSYRPVLYRTYQFEYSENGTDRHHAYVDLLNERITGIRFTGQNGETIYYQ